MVSEKELPIILLEDDFKILKGEKEIVHFIKYICICVRSSDFVFILGYEENDVNIIRKFIDKDSAYKELHLSISIDGATDVPADKYNFDLMNDFSENLSDKKLIDVIH